MSQEVIPVGQARASYESKSASRTTALDRARRASALTIPGMIPEDSQDENSTFNQPYQAFGAQAVASLASRTALALFPPGVPFFRLEIGEEVVAEMGEDLSEAQNRLSVIARSVNRMMEQSIIRSSVVPAMRHLIVAGNVLLYCPPGKPSRIYRLDQYVVSRKADGSVFEAVVKETVLAASLPPNVLAAVGDGETGDRVKLDVFTTIREDPDTGKLHWHQEINNKLVPESEGEAPSTESPWLFLRWLPVPGSDYGRSHVTEYIGDLQTLEDLYKALVDFASVASRIINIVPPQSGIDLKELADAPSGSYIQGQPNSVETLQLNKGQDWGSMWELAQAIERRLGSAFVMAGSTIRDAERVTTEEIRLISSELETALGGTYTLLSSELQLPLVRRFMALATSSGKAPKLPEKVVQPVVVTGFDALGKAHGVNRLRGWAADAIQILGPESFASQVNITGILKRLGDGHGVEDIDGLLKSPEAMAAEQQQAMSQQALMTAAPQIAKVAGDAAMAEPTDQAGPPM